MNVLMVGVSEKRTGGMWTVSKMYLDSKHFNKKVNLTYVATSTSGGLLKRIVKMLVGLFNIWFCIQRKNIDILHAHMAEKGSAFRKGKIIEYAHKKGISTIIHIHAGPFMDWYHSISKKQQKKIKYYLSCADAVIILGEYWKKQMTEIVDTNKLHVLYNGVETIDVNSYNIYARELLYMGRINEKKGIWDLLQAMKKIEGQLPDDVCLVICGEDETGELNKRIKELELEEKIIIEGWVSGKEKQRRYSAAMVSVLPTYVEGLSMSVLEAMSYGIPVATTNVTTMPELLDGIVEMVPAGDVDALAMQLVSLVNNEKRRIEISKMEYERVKEKFSTEKMIENTLFLYYKIGGNKKHE